MAEKTPFRHFFGHGCVASHVASDPSPSLGGGGNTCIQFGAMSGDPFIVVVGVGCCIEIQQTK